MIDKIHTIDKALKIIDHQIPDNEVDLFYRYTLQEKWGIILVIEEECTRFPKLFKFLYKSIFPYL
jgi:hypothetical protein